MRKIYVKLCYVLYALKRISKPHLGDIVDYKGQRCFLIQGVSAPYWDLWDSKIEKRHSHIHQSDFKLDTSLSRNWWAFKHSYKFKMDNWYLIDTFGKSILAPISKY